jgi:glutathione S-transferase
LSETPVSDRLPNAIKLAGLAMTQYKLHCIGASGNSYKVALYLNCAGLDWMPVGIDFAGGETRDAGWRAGVNAMGEVPVLEVAGKRMSQSGAILMWLAETTGHFAPADAEERHEALRWILFDNHKFTNNYAIHRVQNSMTAEPHAAVLSFMRSRAESSFAIVDKHLADRPFVLGKRPTIVDFSMAGYVFYPAEETGFDITTEYPAIHAWRSRIAAMKGFVPPYELMPVGSSMPVRKA